MSSLIYDWYLLGLGLVVVFGAGWFIWRMPSHHEDPGERKHHEHS
ncbi:hypothetical protein [Acidithiobacillus ferridurans]|nr:hypothetical protein [Acidithiobacillus ferridurans]